MNWIYKCFRFIFCRHFLAGKLPGLVDDIVDELTFSLPAIIHLLVNFHLRNCNLSDFHVICQDFDEIFQRGVFFFTDNNQL